MNILFPSVAHIVNILAGLMLASVIMFISRRGLYTCINFFVIHSVLLSLVILTIAIGMGESHLFVGFLLTVLLKVILIPAAFYWIIREIKIKRETQFYINTIASLLISSALVIFSFYIAYGIADSMPVVSKTALALALAMMFSGFFIVVSRTQAITQMLGFLIMENSLFLLISVTSFRIPFFIEVGISFDVLAALLIMGIFLFKINRTFSHISVSQLRENKE